MPSQCAVRGIAPFPTAGHCISSHAQSRVYPLAEEGSAQQIKVFAKGTKPGTREDTFVMKHTYAQYKYRPKAMWDNINSMWT